MPNKTSIEYVDYSSNPIYATYTFINNEAGTPQTKRGHHCVHWDASCTGCYAESWNLRYGTGLRFKAQNTKLIKFALKVKELDELIKLDQRLKQRNQWASCFLGDMTDVFQEGIPEYFLDETFKVLVTLERIIMYIFTKRADRLVAYTEKHDFTTARHLWFFISAGTQKQAEERLNNLMQARVAFRGMSCEPLIEPKMDLEPWLALELQAFADGGIPKFFPRLDWLFIGGESGRSPRPFSLSAARSLIDQGRAHNVPVFMKQLGKRPYPEHSDFEPGKWPASAFLTTIGRHISLGDGKGGDPREWAADLRVREYPRLKFELQPASTEA